jgi:hypothetical protein
LTPVSAQERKILPVDMKWICLKQP